ncbi:MAG: transporter substrate-binding domain-containing protein [Aquabacterium sp.]|nr:MAG: transporter substrate-binding domain-containing protein [Aquabacterium sp.]
MHYLGTTLLALAAALSTGTAQADAEAPVRIGFLEFPPFSYLDAQQQPQGSMLAFARRLTEQAGLRAELTPYPPARLYHNLATGATELTLGATGNPAISDHVLTGKEVIGWIDLRLYYPAGQAAPQLPQGLRCKRLILIHGFTYWAPEARQLLDDASLQLRVSKTHTHLAAIELLQRGRSDYLLDYQPPVEEALAQSGDKKLQGLTLHSLPVSLLLSRHSPRAELLQARLEQAYNELKASGELQQWRQRMHLRTEQQPPDY